MKKFLITAALAASLAAGFAVTAAPASAGTAAIVRADFDRHNDRDGRGGWDRDRNDRGGWDHGRGGRDGDRGGWDREARGLEFRIGELDRRIDDGRRHGSLSYREAGRLNDRLNDIRRDKHRAERTGRGINHQEAAYLDERLDDLSRSIRWQRHDDNRW